MNRPLLAVVAVNGETIPPEAIAAEAQMHPAPKGKPGLAWRAAVRALAVRALLLQEARARGLVAAPRELTPGRFETAEEALIRGLLEAAVQPEVPDEAAVRATWERDPTRFRSAPLWEVSHILCAADPGDERARLSARTRALALGARLQSDPAAFAALAARERDCGSKTNCGALGQLRPGDSVPEFEAALWPLAPGEIVAEPVATRYGWHLIRMDDRAEGRVLPYSAARPVVEAALEKAAWARAARAFVAGLVAGAQITGVDFAANELADAG